MPHNLSLWEWVAFQMQCVMWHRDMLCKVKGPIWVYPFPWKHLKKHFEFLPKNYSYRFHCSLHFLSSHFTTFPKVIFSHKSNKAWEQPQNHGHGSHPLTRSLLRYKEGVEGEILIMGKMEWEKLGCDLLLRVIGHFVLSTLVTLEWEEGFSLLCS